MAYAFHAILEAEKCYAKIEKEALVITWACKKFACYVLGTAFQIESDHTADTLVEHQADKQFASLYTQISVENGQIQLYHTNPRKAVTHSRHTVRAPLPNSTGDTTV